MLAITSRSKPEEGITECVTLHNCNHMCASHGDTSAVQSYNASRASGFPKSKFTVVPYINCKGTYDSMIFITSLLPSFCWISFYYLFYVMIYDLVGLVYEYVFFGSHA